MIVPTEFRHTISPDRSRSEQMVPRGRPAGGEVCRAQDHETEASFFFSISITRTGVGSMRLSIAR